MRVAGCEAGTEFPTGQSQAQLPPYRFKGCIGRTLNPIEVCNSYVLVAMNCQLLHTHHRASPTSDNDPLHPSASGFLTLHAYTSASSVTRALESHLHVR